MATGRARWRWGRAMTADILRLSDAEAKALSPEELNAISEEEMTAMQARALSSASQTLLTPTFPADVYPAWLARYAQEVTRAVEVPPGIADFVILGMLGACYGTHLQLALKHGYVRYCHDFFFLIADVSVGKSGLLRYMAEPLRQIQRNLREHAEEDGPRPQVIISDATPEAMLKVQHNNGGAAAMVSPETPLLAQLSATGGKEWAVQPYLSSHTGEPYQVDRIMREQNDIECARLAIVAATQPETLKLVAQRPFLESSGFLARCTFYVCPPMTEADLHPDDPEVSDELQDRYTRTVRELGLRYRSNSEAPLRFDSEAREARRVWIAEHRRRYKVPGAELHHLAGFCAKLEEKVSRWAGLLHVLWCEEENREPGVLTLTDWQRGLKLYDFAFAHYSAAHGLIVEAPSEAVAKKVKSYCERHRGQTVKLRDLKRHVTAFKRADERTQDAALALLEEDGIVQRATLNTGGRPSKVIIVL